MFVQFINLKIISLFFLVICNYEIPPERSFDWTSALFQYIHPESVYVFDTVLDSHYSVNNLDMKPPLLRKIETRIKKQHKQLDCAFLESPNLIEKGSAAVATYCELKGIPASIYVSLEDSRQLECATLRAFEPVLLGLNLQHQHYSTLANSYSAAIKIISEKKLNTLFL